MLGRPSHRVTVQCLRMGGGFGGKEMQPHGLRRGRGARRDPDRATGAAPADPHPGHDDDRQAARVPRHLAGRLRRRTAGSSALEATLTADGGWSLDLSEPVLARALCHVDNAYLIPDIRVQGRIAQTNKTSQTAFRGFGGPAGDARDRGHPRPLRAAARDRPGGPAPPQLLHRGAAHAVRPAGAARPTGSARPGTRSSPTGTTSVAAREVEAFNAAHPHTKRGLAMTPVKFGISFNFTSFNQAGALVHVYKDGSVLINHGGTEMGQGLHTKMLQVAATALGLPLERVRLAPTRTDKVPNTSATAASLRRRPQRRGGQARLRPDPRAAGPPRRRARRRLPGPELGGARPARLPRQGATLGRGLLPDRGAALGRGDHAGLALQVLRVRRSAGRGGGRRLHRRPPHPPRRHRPRRRATASRRWSTSVRSRAASCRAPAG